MLYIILKNTSRTCIRFIQDIELPTYPWRVNRNVDRLSKFNFNLDRHSFFRRSIEASNVSSRGSFPCFLSSSVSRLVLLSSLFSLTSLSLSFSLWQETISSAAFNLNASFRIFQSPFCRFLNRYAILPSFSLPDRLYRFVRFRSTHEERVPSSKTALTWNHPLLLSLIYL